VTQKTHLLLTTYYLVAWFACAQAASKGYILETLFIPIPGLILLFFLWTGSTFKRLRVILLSMILSVLGLWFDSVSSNAGFVHFSPVIKYGLVPVWLVSFWLLFSIVLPPLSLFFKRRIGLASILALLLGPLSYKAGEQWNLVKFPNQTGFLVYAAFWAIYFPLSVIILNLIQKEN
jgi:hypothetical protein